MIDLCKHSPLCFASDKVFITRAFIMHKFFFVSLYIIGLKYYFFFFFAVTSWRLAIKDNMWSFALLLNV